MTVILSDWRGPRMLGFRWGKFRWEWGTWEYHIDKWGAVIMLWSWEKDHTNNDPMGVNRA